MALLAPWAVAQQALPYSYGFEDDNLSVDGWELVGSTSNNTGIVSSAAYNGSFGFRFNYSEQGAFLMSPLLTGTDSGVALSFYYKEYSSSYGDEQFYVGYTTDETNSDPTTFTYGSIVTASTSWQLYETTLPAGVKRVAIQYVYNDALYLYLDDFTFEAPGSCVKPSGLAATLTPGNGTVATLNWTAGGTETAWVLEYGTASDFTGATSVNVSGTPTKALTGLVAETTYYARVKANCGGGDQSAWCNDVCTFTPTDAYEITVNDGTVTNSYVPYYSYYHDSQQRSEFIIPASSLEDMAWGTITSMKFYPNYSFTTTASIQVYLMEVSEETFSDVTFYTEDGATIVYTGTLGISPDGMTITCGEGYQYMGGNLLVGFYQATSGSGYYNSSSCPFYGVTAEGASISQYSSYSGLRNFLPKTTFGYLPGEEPTCLKPTGVTVSEVTAHSAVLSWTSEATAWQIQVNEETPVNVTANPYTLTGLEPETDYAVKVRANCGSDGYSDWTTAVSFPTEPACYAPTDMVISDITAYSANIAWTSENTNFELRYSPDVRPLTDFDDSQMHGWTNIDADGDGYEWVLGSECGGIYLVEGGSLAGTGHNASADMVTSGSYSNYTGAALTPDNYLVSPQITLGGSISFWACAQDGSYAAEHFGVAVSTTGNTDADDFTTIQEWDMTAKSAPVLRSSNAPRGGNRAQGNWYQYTVDLSDYTGQGYVAIRHFNCTDMFLLNVDDIFIEEPGFEMPWVNVSNPTNPQALTNLDPETTYLVQVRANCGSDGYSEWLEGSFTTLPACMVPTGLTVSNIDKRSADLAWTANGEETAWQIMVNGDEDNLIYVTETSYTLTDLEPETSYTVKVRAYCDAELQSHWSSPATFTTLVACPAPTGLAISDITNVSAVATWTYDGDVELEYAEDVWKYYDNGTFGTSMGAGGTIYWGILLTPNMLPANQPLTHIAMYENGNNANPTTISIYSGGDAAPGTFLYSEEVTPVGNGFHEIALAEPVEFDATQNLWIVCYNDADAYPAAGSADLTNPNGRWVSLDGEEWADLNGYGFNYTWMIRAAFGNNTQTEWVAVNNPASPQTITGLTPETNYLVRLRAVCGGEDGESVWTSTMFTTTEACPAPSALAATPYANSAVLSWEGISDSYTVSYRTPAVMGGIDEQFAATSIPTGWSLSNTLLTDDVLNGTTTINSSTGGWIFGSANGVFNTHARVNIYGTGCKYWLITPAISVPADATFSFDLALTAYSGTSVPAPATTGTDDRFVVLISTDDKATWTILRQWDNNDGSVYVYNDIANTATGENVSFDFSDYARQTVYIAFYGESTTSNADNNLHIDNVYVTVDELIPAGEWETVTVEEATATITGLEPETTYEWKVEGDCGEFGMSEESAIASFTTTDDLCPLPTDLAATNITATTADLSWTASPDVESFVVRYRAPEHIVGGISESFDASSFPAGWTGYKGLVDNVVAGTATLTTGMGWSISSYALGEYNTKVNIYGTSVNNWLVTPEVTPTSGTFTFDLALTDYGNENPIENDTLQADDRFVVLVYADDAWTILREWNNTGSDYVYNTIATEGEAVSIDLSDYVGQTVKIAFYGESTVSGNGDNDLHIDNVVIGEPVTIPATEWEEVRASSNSLTLEDLTPETPYEAQVQNDCDSENWSAVVTFTTTEEEIGEEGEIEYYLPGGWTWVSSCVEFTDDALGIFQDAIAAENTYALLKSSNPFTMLNGDVWSGSLTSLENEQMYMIDVDNDVQFIFDGDLVDPALHPITLPAGGWAWIGNLLSETTSVIDALAGLNAHEGDVIKSQGQTSMFNGTTWSNAFELESGQGLMYYNSDTEDKTLIYPSNAKSAAPRVEVEKHWTNDVHRFATNLSMMATIDASVFAVSEYYEIGAFVNGECRGSARLQKVDGNYVAFLTVSGNDGDQVNFMLYDFMGNEVKGTAEESIVYVSDNIIGSVNNPMMLHFNNTGVNELDGMVSMFPNPTKDNVKIFGNGIQMVKVYNTLGQMVYSEECGNATEVELNLSAFSAGVYTVSVLTNGQVTNKAVVKE